MELYHEWTTASDERQAEIWHEMLKIYAGQCYTIGLVSGVLQPVARAPDLATCPRRRSSTGSRTASSASTCLDTFWYDH